MAKWRGWLAQRNVRALRTMVAWLVLLCCSGCWRSRVIAPARANDPSSTGYGVLSHSGFWLTVYAVGIVAQAPPRVLGKVGDSLWAVRDAHVLDYCEWRTPGTPHCVRVPFPDNAIPGGDPIVIIDPVNLGQKVQQTVTYDAATGSTQTQDLGGPVRVVTLQEFTPDRAIWVLGGAGGTPNTRLYRCALAPSRKPICQVAQL